MFLIAPDHDTIQNALKHFSDAYHKKLSESEIWTNEYEQVYTSCSNDILKDIYIMNMTKNNVKKTEKPLFPIPFCGYIVSDWCNAIKKNHRLYTQCTKARAGNSRYCKICQKQANNNANGVPNCGDIKDRLEKWDGKLNFKPDGMKKEIPYANLMDKLEVTWEDVCKETDKLHWNIPECHKVVKKARRGRPSKTPTAVSDTDEDTPPKKRGRPKKAKKKEMSDDELIAALCGM